MSRWALRGLAAVLLAGCSMAGPPPDTRTAGPPAEPVPVEPRPEPLPPPRTPAPERARRAVPTPFPEVRAVWVVRSTLTDPDRIRDMVERADAAGINALLVQVRGRGDAYYSSALEPRARALAGQEDFDPLTLVLREAHARGMKVHAWVNIHLVANAARLPEDPGHVVNARPDLLAVPRELATELYRVDPGEPSYVEALRRHALANADRVEGLFTNPAHPDVRERILDVWMDLVTRYPLDGMHLDYVRYPLPSYDYSRPSLEAFARWARPRVGPVRAGRLARAGRDDPLAWVDALPGEWARFRREQITRLVDRLHRGVKAVRPDVVVSAAVVPDRLEAYTARFQDWPGWLEAGIVDVVAPMAYTSDDARFRRQIREAVAAAGDPRRVWAGVGTWMTGFDGTVRKITIAREVGAGGVALFSYDWMVDRGRTGTGEPFLQGVGRRSFPGR